MTAPSSLKMLTSSTPLMAFMDIFFKTLLNFLSSTLQSHSQGQKYETADPFSADNCIERPITSTRLRSGLVLSSDGTTSVGTAGVTAEALGNHCLSCFLQFRVHLSTSIIIKIIVQEGSLTHTTLRSIASKSKVQRRPKSSTHCEPLGGGETDTAAAVSHPPRVSHRGGLHSGHGDHATTNPLAGLRIQESPKLVELPDQSPINRCPRKVDIRDLWLTVGIALRALALILFNRFR